MEQRLEIEPSPAVEKGDRFSRVSQTHTKDRPPDSERAIFGSAEKRGGAGAGGPGRDRRGRDERRETECSGALRATSGDVEAGLRPSDSGGGGDGCQGASAASLSDKAHAGGELRSEASGNPRPSREKSKDKPSQGPDPKSEDRAKDSSRTESASGLKAVEPGEVVVVKWESKWAPETDGWVQVTPSL